MKYVVDLFGLVLVVSLITIIVFDAFSKAGITILEMKKSETTLEDAFIKLISEDKKEGGEE